MHGNGHACPRRRRHGFETEYLATFKRHSVADDGRIRSRKDKKSLPPQLPVRPLNRSISREDYIQHAMSPTVSLKPISNPIPYRPTQDVTTYATHFTTWVPPQRPRIW